MLAPLALAGWAVIHDRRVPGSDANVDHLVIGPTGLWVIDTKAYRGRVKLLGDQRLWYGRTCLDDVLRIIRWLAARVGQLLADACVEAPAVSRPLLCIHGARLPCDPMHWQGVLLTSPAMLLDVLVGSVAVLDRGTAGNLAIAAAEVLPPASRPVR